MWWEMRSVAWSRSWEDEWLKKKKKQSGWEQRRRETKKRELKKRDQTSEATRFLRWRSPRQQTHDAHIHLYTSNIKPRMGTRSFFETLDKQYLCPPPFSTRASFTPAADFFHWRHRCSKHRNAASLLYNSTALSLWGFFSLLFVAFRTYLHNSSRNWSWIRPGFSAGWTCFLFFFKFCGCFIPKRLFESSLLVLTHSDFFLSKGADNSWCVHHFFYRLSMKRV